MAEQTSKKQKREERREAERLAAESPDGPFSPWMIRAVACVPVLAALVTYAPYLDGGFLFDDVPAIRDNPAIHAGNWMQAAFGEPHSPVSNRPLTTFTLAVDFAMHRLNPRGYHVFSLAVHLANVALLFGIVRRTLRGPILGRIFDAPMALFTAAGLALPWAVHPLLSEAVIYVTQRTTLLMSFFMLVAIYCLLRGNRSPERRLAWDSGAVAGCLGGMMSKEEFIAVPLLLILFERAYLYPSWAAMKGRTSVYLSLLATMLVVLICVAMGPRNTTVGYDTSPRATAGEWLMTEAGVIVHYLRLAALPYPLVGAYDWPVVRNFSEAVLPGAAVLLLLGTTIYLLWSRPWWGWLGAMFFLLLAPSSSVFPIITEIVAERRMYLPVLIYTVPTVVGFTLLLDYLRRRYNPSLGVCVGVVSALVAVPNGLAMYAAAEHAAVFRDEATFWADVYSKNDCENKSFQCGLILNGYGKTVRDQGRVAEAAELFRRATECDQATGTAGGNYAAALVDLGRFPEAEVIYRKVLATDTRQVDANLSEVRANFAWMLCISFQTDPSITIPSPEDPRLIEAERVARKSVELQSFRANSYNVLATVLFFRGNFVGAEQAFREALAREPGHKHARENLAKILKLLGREAEAAALLSSQA